jgi:hypothetical protein
VVSEPTTHATVLPMFSPADWTQILESLAFTRKAYEEYDRYPSAEFRQQQLTDLGILTEKVRQARTEAKKSS